MNVLLMGLRGCGKTTVGRLLAAQLRRPFVDLDERVLADFPENSVRAVWARAGEPAWRRAEARALEEVTGGNGRIVALGGGTPAIDAARSHLETQRQEGRARLVYLRCEPAELARRLAGEVHDRPSLTGADPRDEIEVVLKAREPIFRSLADLEYDVTENPPQRVAEALAELVAGR